MKNKTTFAYISLIFVILVWGCSPLITLDLYKYYSPTIRVCFSEFVLIIAYLLISGKHIKEFNFDYIKIGVPTGFFLALANITQKIGLPYTTPARYAFLENLSCISVPILMYFLIKKKPNLMTAVACVVCMVSSKPKSLIGFQLIMCIIADISVYCKMKQLSCKKHIRVI